MIIFSTYLGQNMEAKSDIELYRSSLASYLSILYEVSHKDIVINIEKNILIWFGEDIDKKVVCTLNTSLALSRNKNESLSSKVSELLETIFSVPSTSYELKIFDLVNDQTFL